MDGNGIPLLLIIHNCLIDNTTIHQMTINMLVAIFAL